MVKMEHPKALILLFATEMWERFSFYTMRALVVLYMAAALVDGGLGWTRKEALHLYALYMGIAYITPILGGFLSDRFFGQRKSAMVGSFILAMGYFCMLFKSVPFFYAALGLIAIGNGLFKPCMTSILGQLYEDTDESQRDSAYSIFYMGINIGGMLAGFASGILLSSYGYEAGFLTAGLGMLLALVIFFFGQHRYLGKAGLAPRKKELNVSKEALTDDEKKKLGVVGFLFVVTLIFIAAWEQMGGLITLFINNSIERTIGGFTIPTPWLANIDPLMIVLLAPCMSLFWNYLGSKGKDPSIAAKMGIGSLALSLSFVILSLITPEPGTKELPSFLWIILNKLLVVIGELAVIPISWAAVSRFAPTRYISLAVGLMLAAIGVGSYLAGEIGSLVDDVGEKVIFNSMTATMALLSLLCFALSKPTTKLTTAES